MHDTSQISRFMIAIAMLVLSPMARADLVGIVNDIPNTGC